MTMMTSFWRRTQTLVGYKALIENLKNLGLSPPSHTARIASHTTRIASHITDIVLPPDRLCTGKGQWWGRGRG